MYAYMFMIVDGDKNFISEINNLINKYDGKFIMTNSDLKYIYETEFAVSDNLEKFKAELDKLIKV